MIIRKKRIRSIGNNIRGVKRGDQVVVVLQDLARFNDRLVEVGFSSNLNVGETILPAPTGPVSRFNAKVTMKSTKINRWKLPAGKQNGSGKNSGAGVGIFIMVIVMLLLARSGEFDFW